MRRTTTLFLAMLCCLATVFAQDDYLYSQLGEIGNFYASAGTKADGESIQAEIADDFEVPAEGMEAYSAVFYRNTEDEKINAFSVKVYEDEFGVPGTELKSFNITSWETDAELYGSTGEYKKTTVDFPEPLVLEQGTYWISFVVMGAQGAYNHYIAINTTSEVQNSPLKVKSFYDYFGNPIASPLFANYRDRWGNGFGMYNNMAFALKGKPANVDVAAVAIVEPVHGVYKDSVAITAQVANKGLETLSTLNLMYTISTMENDKLKVFEQVSETIDGLNLAYGQVLEYTFKDSADFTQLGAYYIDVMVGLSAGDEKPVNDVVSGIVNNYAGIYPMGKEESYTICGGVFTDNGGVLNGYGEESIDTVTLFPATDGTRLSLTFDVFDVYWNDFKTFTIYDGTSTESPILVQGGRDVMDNDSWLALFEGQTFTARNPQGALTIAGDENNTPSGSYAGWEASVTCVVPQSISFSMLNAMAGYENNWIYENAESVIKAVVTNAGADTIARKVYFIEDGITVGSVMSKKLIPGALDTVEFAWTPSFATVAMGIEARIENDPQATNHDNSIRFDVPVFMNGQLVESFESVAEKALPLNWVSNQNSSSVLADKNGSYATHGQMYLKGAKGDTIIMPRMQFSTENSMLYWHGYASKYAREADVYYVLAAESLSGPWDTVAVVPVQNQATYNSYMTDYSAAMSNYTDKPYYFALTGGYYGSLNYIDYVRGGIIKPLEKDLLVSHLQLMSPAINQVGEEFTFKATISNAGAFAVDASSYSLNIFENDSVYFSVPGVDIEAQQTAEIHFVGNFATADTIVLNVAMVFEGDMNTTNDTANAQVELVVTEGYVSASGEASSSSYKMIYLANKKRSVSQSVFYPSHMNGYGDITGMSFNYKYYGTNYDTIEAMPLRIYMAYTTDSSVFDNGNIVVNNTDSLEYVKVFDNSITVYPTESNFDASIFIEFDTPFSYNGKENVNLLIIRDSIEQLASTYFYMQTTSSNISSDQGYLNWYAYNNDSIVANEFVGADFDYISKEYKVLPLLNWYWNTPGEPLFESTPLTTVNQYSNYDYSIEVAFDSELQTEVEAISLPEWLSLSMVNDTIYTLSGTPQNNGVFPVQLTVGNSMMSSTQSFSISVAATPVFNNEPETDVLLGQEFVYPIEVSYTGMAAVEISADAPAWLSFVDNGNNTASLTGEAIEAGTYNVTLTAKGEVISTQSFTITVGDIPMFELDDAYVAEGAVINQTLTSEYNGVNNLNITAELPAWITLTDNNDGTAIISADSAEVGEYSLYFTVSDGVYSFTDSMLLTVGAVPVFITQKLESAQANQAYTAIVEVAYNGTETVEIDAITLPEWLTISDNGDGTATLNGTPEHVLVETIVLVAQGEYETTYTTYKLDVLVTATDRFSENLLVYPNPASTQITLMGVENSRVEIYTIDGQLLFAKQNISSTNQIDISQLSSGVYMLSVHTENGTIVKQLVVE